MELDGYRQASFRTWEAMAPGWERWRSQLADGQGPIREWLVAQLDPQPGETVLELSAGVGDAGFDAAERLGSEGRLISTDISPDMVAAARRRGEQRGISNAEHAVMDAEQLDLGDDSADGVLCQSGLMLMADRVRALSEARRVLRPGGRLVFSVWGAPDRNPWATIPSSILIEGGHMPRPEAGTPGIFSMASEDHTRELLAAAGFDSVSTEEVEMSFDFGDMPEYGAWVSEVAGAISMVLDGLSESERDSYRSALREHPGLAAHASGEGLSLPGVALCASAR